MEKNWSTLEKGDSVYLLVPYTEDGIIKYDFQESQVINVKKSIIHYALLVQNNYHMHMKVVLNSVI